jgi:hypothetical protein
MLGQQRIAILQSKPSPCCVGTAGASRASYNADQITELTALEAVDLLCSRRVTAVQYATALLNRAAEVDCLNTYASLDRARVRTPAQDQPQNSNCA